MRKLKIEIVKTVDGDFHTLNPSKLNVQLDSLVPGTYIMTFEKPAERLITMKQFYFKMESGLASHLGIKKVDLHKDLMRIFTKFNIDEKEVYDSIAEINNEQDMMDRIILFQEYAAYYHGYKAEPFTDIKTNPEDIK